MALHSKQRCHLLNFEKALDVLDTSGFMSAKTCAECDHLIPPAAKMGLNQLSPQRQHSELCYDDDEQIVLSYCLARVSKFVHAKITRSPDAEKRIHMLIREAYPTHQPAHTGIRTEEQVLELKQAFNDAGSPQPNPATKAEVDAIWRNNMNTPDIDRRLKNPRVQV
jgi:hypothetical protein